MEHQGVGGGEESHAQEAAASLVARIAAGDRRAEAELVALHDRGLRYFLRRRCGDHELAEDLFQETFRVVLEKLRGGALRDADKLAPFVRGVARNLTIAERRKRFRRGVPASLERVAEPVDGTPGAERQLERREDRRRLRQLLAELPNERYRSVLFRFYITGEPKEAIARDLGLEPRQVNVVLFRARQRFRQLLEAAGWSGDEAGGEIRGEIDTAPATLSPRAASSAARSAAEAIAAPGERGEG